MRKRWVGWMGRSMLLGMLLAAFLCVPVLSSAAEISSQKTMQSWAYVGVSGVQAADLEKISALARNIHGVEYATVNPDAKEPNTLVLRKSESADWSQILEAVTALLHSYKS